MGSSPRDVAGTCRDRSKARRSNTAAMRVPTHACDGRHEFQDDGARARDDFAPGIRRIRFPGMSLGF